MESKTILKGSQVLWQNKTWSIEKISQKEIVITNGSDICYCYISADLKRLFVERKIYPSYIENKAIKLASTNIESIYA